MRNYSPAELVDPYIGSIGHLLTATEPLVKLPHAMAQIRPLLDPEIKDIYLAETIFGFPLNGGRVMVDAGDEPTFQSRFDHDQETVKCYQGRVLLEDSGVWAEYTASAHGALYRFHFADGARGRVRLQAGADGSLRRRDDHTYTGVCADKGVKRYFAARLCADAPLAEEGGDAQSVCHSLPAGATLRLEAGFSFIDEEQALDNLGRELAGRAFEAIALAGKEAWDEILGRIEIEGGTERQRRIFYTSLYRVLRRMVNISEYGRYFSAYDGRVHEDTRDFYVDDGVWDTYRGAHPLQGLLEPARHADILHSYLRMYEQSGWLPSFPRLEGDVAVMIGKHAASLLTDAWAKGERDFDPELAWEAMQKNAEQTTKLPWRFGPINDFDRCYFENGFFPALPEGQTEWLPAHPFERRQCVAVTLETAYDDWCLSEFARMLGKTEESARYARRALNYRQVFNPATGFMSPRTADGKWVEPFDPKLSGGQGGRAYFAECNAWTYTMHVQHDPAGLAALLGGPQGLSARLDRMFSEQYGTSKFTFLGQFPDSTGLIGQFCQGNEPSFHIPYLYNYAGQPWQTQRRVRQIMELWYDDTPLGICGDEDGGAMCAWYVFSALGFYPLCPGRAQYDLGSPLFDEARLHLENGNTFVIRAEGQSARHKYVAAASINGAPLREPRLEHVDILSGGALTLAMSERPAKSL